MNLSTQTAKLSIQAASEPTVELLKKLLAQQKITNDLLRRLIESRGGSY